MAEFDLLGLDGFNELADDRAEAALLACCSSRRWVQDVLAGRPYSSGDEVFAAADAALRRMSEADVDDALAGHPRIGERAVGDWSRREQAGVTGAPDVTLAAIAEGNRAYEERFGHVYMVRATGRSAEEMLEILRQRLRNESAVERQAVRTELGKINRIRLEKVLATRSGA